MAIHVMLPDTTKILMIAPNHRGKQLAQVHRTAQIVAQMPTPVTISILAAKTEAVNLVVQVLRESLGPTRTVTVTEDKTNPVVRVE